MPTEKKSFWSSLPGMVTGAAGVVGAIVGVISVLIALGVIGGSNSSPTATTPGEGSFTVRPDALVLSLATKPKASVTVSNNGSVPLKIDPPEVSGPDKAKFTVPASGCSSLAAKKTCTIDVTFTGGLNATATMTVTADKADPVTVDLTGSL